MEGDVLFYGQKPQHKYLYSDLGDEPGNCLEIVTGVGSKSRLAFTPLTKSLWICVGFHIGFHVYKGRDLGSIRICAKDMLSHKEQLFKLACGFLCMAHQGDKKPYDQSLCQRDFGVHMTQVLHYSVLF